MNIRFINPKIHGILDYVAAVNLIVFPFLLNLGASSPIALWLSVVAGVGLVGYSLFTDYTFSVTKALSFKIHLLLDLAAGAVFIVAIFVFGFEGLVAAYYAVMAIGVFALVAVTNLGESAAAEDTPVAEAQV